MDNGAEYPLRYWYCGNFLACLLCWNRTVRFLWLMCWVFCYLYLIIFGPLKALYGEASRLTVMNAALDRIEAVLDEPELSDNGKQHIPAQAQPGQPEVLFNDVTFAYQDKEVLHHISFAMKKNFYDRAGWAIR